MLAEVPRLEAAVSTFTDAAADTRAARDTFCFFPLRIDGLTVLFSSSGGFAAAAGGGLEAVDDLFSGVKAVRTEGKSELSFDKDRPPATTAAAVVVVEDAAAAAATVPLEDL